MKLLNQFQLLIQTDTFLTVTRIVDLTNNTVFYIFPDPDDNNIVFHATLESKMGNYDWGIQIWRGIHFYLIESDHIKVWEGKAYTAAFTGIATIKVKSNNLHAGEYKLTAYYPGSDEVMEPMYPSESSSQIILVNKNPIGAELNESNQNSPENQIQKITGQTVAMQNTGTPVIGPILALLLVIGGLFTGYNKRRR